MSQLFTPFSLRGVTFRNRIFVAPMCMYSSLDGVANDWHLVHLGSRAVGGAGLVMVEATAVSPEGRISPHDSGLWDDRQAEAFRPITRFLRAHGAIPAIQLGHAGRKASTDVPWRGGGFLLPEGGGWQPLAPSPVLFAPGRSLPRELTVEDLDRIEARFSAAAGRALAAGFEVVEVHMAHGYLLHQFLSPHANRRSDAFGGSLENRLRFPLRVARAVRAAWPQDRPVFARLSVTDWTEGGWDLAQSVILSRELQALGIDLIDCSSGAISPDESIPAGPGFQVPFAAAIRREAGIATGAVGFITAPVQAEQIVATGQADAVFLARELLRDPYWPLHAASALGVDLPWPEQYQRAKR